MKPRALDRVVLSSAESDKSVELSKPFSNDEISDHVNQITRLSNRLSITSGTKNEFATLLEKLNASIMEGNHHDAVTSLVRIKNTATTSSKNTGSSKSAIDIHTQISALSEELKAGIESRHEVEEEMKKAYQEADTHLTDKKSTPSRHSSDMNGDTFSEDFNSNAREDNYLEGEDDSALDLNELSDAIKIHNQQHPDADDIYEMTLTDNIFDIEDDEIDIGADALYAALSKPSPPDSASALPKALPEKPQPLTPPAATKQILQSMQKQGDQIKKDYSPPEPEQPKQTAVVTKTRLSVKERSMNPAVPSLLKARDHLRIAITEAKKEFYDADKIQHHLDKMHDYIGRAEQKNAKNSNPKQVTATQQFIETISTQAERVQDKLNEWTPSGPRG